MTTDLLASEWLAESEAAGDVLTAGVCRVALGLPVSGASAVSVMTDSAVGGEVNEAGELVDFNRAAARALVASWWR